METSTGTSAAAEAWVKRVEAWRASGKRAEEFSRREGYAASTLRWWASKLRHEMPTAPEVRLARVVRTVTAAASPTEAGAVAAIVIETGPRGVRIAVSQGADRDTLALVLDVLRVGVTR